MGFIDSIETCIFKKYATFRGRAKRSEYWCFWLFCLLYYYIYFFCLSLFVRIRNYDNSSVSTIVGIAIIVIGSLLLYYYRKYALDAPDAVYSKFRIIALLFFFGWFVLYNLTGDGIVGLLIIFGLSFFLVLLCPTLAVSVRRLRDAGLGWYHLLWILIPIIGIFVVTFLMCLPSKEENIKTYEITGKEDNNSRFMPQKEEKTKTVEEKVYCKYCGKETNAESEYCKYCGKPLNK